MDTRRHEADVLDLTAAMIGVHKALSALAADNPPKMHEEFYDGMRTITTRLDKILARITEDRGAQK